MNLYHRGEPIFLYTRFQDTKGNFVKATHVQVRILHEKKGQVVEDLPWTDMDDMTETEYAYTWQVPFNADYGFYEVSYKGKIATSQAENVEEFHIIGTSERFEDTVKIYGHIHQARKGDPIISADILVMTTDTQEEIYRTFSDNGGLWEVYVYPGQYEFRFDKAGFSSISIIADINSQNNEVQFDNVVMELDGPQETSRGTGVYTVSDQYTTKEGYELVGLHVTASTFFDPNTIIAKTTTDSSGKWELYLDPGFYLLRVTGNTFSTTFNQIFRLKVSDAGKATFENITANVANVVQPGTLTPGSGSVLVEDVVLDKQNNPVIDVTVKATTQSAPAIIVAEAETDVGGKWAMNLDPGTYIFTFSHPMFLDTQEVRTIS